MATANPFDLLGDDDIDDPSQLIAAAQQQKIAAKKPAPAVVAAAARLPTKPAPPSQAGKDSRSNAAPARGSFPGGIGGGRGGPGRARGGRGSGPSQGTGYGNGNVNGLSGGYGSTGGGGEDGETGKPVDRERGSYGGPRQSYRGARRGGFGDGEDGGDPARPRRVFERRSGTGRGNELKREGSGRGNWGNPNDDVLAQEGEEVKSEEKALATDKQPAREVAPTHEENKESKEGADNEGEEKEPEDKEMTLEEYEKVREEKRKALLAMKAEERKVDFDKDFESMQQLSVKKDNDVIFVKLGSEKDSRRRDSNADRDDRVKKSSVSINAFLKPADGERRYGGGRGRGRGDRGIPRGGFGGGGGNNNGVTMAAAPAIDDPGHFPTLGGKQ